jgi:hypothetical protein
MVDNFFLDTGGVLLLRSEKMIQYASERVNELKIQRFISNAEIRDEQWVDIELRFVLAEDSDQIPEDISDLTGLVICNHSGAIAQMVPQDAGCDCEFQFTPAEKEQISKFILESRIVEKTLKQPK